MAPKRKLPFHSVLDERRLLDWLATEGVKPVHAKRIWRHVLATGAAGGIRDVPELPKAIYERLPKVFGEQFLTSKLVAEQHSSDGATTKMLIELQDGLRVESVIMRYDTSMKRGESDASDTESEMVTGNKRATLCVSSQVGCAMGCTFCATGMMGMIADLTAGEILEQLVLANRVTRIRNVVFMGMGEPLNNYREVSGAVRAMIDPQRFGLSGSHVTVSTVGVIPKIVQMAEDLPTVNFALSLHAPTQELRLQIVPTAKLYPLPKLMAAVDEHHRKSGRGVFVEYVVLRGVNDQEEHARQLGALLNETAERAAAVTVNLIPWNPMLATDGAEPFDAPDPRSIQAFHHILMADYKIPCTVRMTLGQDIDGACGQLALNKGLRNPRSEQKGCGSSSGDIEDLAGVSGSRPASKASKRSGGASGEGGGSTGKGGAAAPCDRADCCQHGQGAAYGYAMLESATTAVALVGPAMVAAALLASLARRVRL